MYVYAVYFWMNYISHPCVFLNLSHFETFCLSPYTFLPVLPCPLKEAFGVDWAPLKMATQDQGVSPREQHPPVRPAPIDKAVGNPAARKRKKTTLVCRRCGAPWSRRRSSSPTEWRRAGWTTCPRCKSRSAETAAMARTVTRDCSYACVRACVCVAFYSPSQKMLGLCSEKDNVIYQNAILTACAGRITYHGDLQL